MSSETVTPIAARLTTFVRQDDNPPRNGAISAAVNVPDETIARGVRWVDDNRLEVEIDLPAMVGLLDEEIADYELHRANSGGAFHNPADAANVFPFSMAVPTGSVEIGCIRANALKSVMRAHFLNTGGSYHDNTDVAGEAALGAVPDADDSQSLRTLILAIKAIQNTHLTAVSVHPVNDGSNVVTAADSAVFSVPGPIAFPGRPDRQVFTSNDNWSPPEWATDDSDVDVYLVACGGAGGSGARRASGVSCSGGAGGRGGGVSHRRIKLSMLSYPVAITGGSPGTGGSAVTVDNTNGNAGTNGGDVTFGSYLTARGGDGGGGGKAGAAASGGAGGQGDINGGAGGDGVDGGVGGAGGFASGAGGGGAGGGIDGADVTYAGGNGGLCAGNPGTAAAGGAPGGNPGTGGASSTIQGPGNGGGGGGAGGIAAGNGGSAGNYGGGGGGGGSSRNLFNSGQGGNGGGWIAVVITS